MQVSLARSGNKKLADQKLDERLKRYPDDLALQRHAAGYYMGEGRDTEAIRLLEDLRVKQPNNAQVLNDLATLYQKQKDDRALGTAERAHILDATDPAIADTYGWLLVEQGQAGRGLELLRYAMDKARNVPVVRYHYAAALAKTGNKSEARKTLEELLHSNQAFPELEAAKSLLKAL
jgi:predicted Zn-dependent protease